jgi:hypothetical protein
VKPPGGVTVVALPTTEPTTRIWASFANGAENVAEAGEVVPVLETGDPTIGALVFAPAIWTTSTTASLIVAAPVIVKAAVELAPSAQNACTQEELPEPPFVLTAAAGRLTKEPVVGPPLTERVGLLVLSCAETITSTTAPLTEVYEFEVVNEVELPLDKVDGVPSAWKLHWFVNELLTADVSEPSVAVSV